jgi:TRAP transporter 4TM/12TM fusion protein
MSGVMTPHTGTAPAPGDWPRWLSVYAGAIAIFHLWANTLGTLPTLWLNSLHLGLLGSLLSAAAATRRRLSPAARTWHVVLGGLVLAGGVYPILAEEALRARGEVMSAPDRIAAAVTVVVALILCRRVSGWTMPALVLLAASYIVFFGRYLDGILHFRGLGWERVLYRYYFTGEGLFGMVATISATFVFMFILFSAFLLKSGAGELIIRLARIVTGRLAGGAGYVAIVASGLTGTITGSAVANTVSTGSITIPLMKRTGFSPAFAAGLEAAASTGGQFMPPVMGAGAFLMAQFTGLSYGTIIAAAFLPAVLYFLSLAFYVFFEARRQGLKPIQEERPERLGAVCREGLHFFIPLAVLIGLLVAGFSPTFAAGSGIVAVVAASWLTRRQRMRWRDIAEALVLGTRNALPTGLLLLCTGLVVGSLNMTGTGVGFSQMVISWSGGHLLPALVLIALASLVLGLGLPVTAAYVMLATVAVPVMQEMGVGLLAAHMIIFWLSQDSNVTPPVCLAAFAAAGIADAAPLPAAMHAWRTAKALYVIPLLFAYTPFIAGSWSERLGVGLMGAAGLLALTAAMVGHGLKPLRIWQRAGLVMIAVPLLHPSRFANVAALVVLVAAGVLFTRNPGGEATAFGSGRDR